MLETATLTARISFGNMLLPTYDGETPDSNIRCSNILQRVRGAVVCRQQQEQEWRERVRRMGAGAAGKQAWPGCTALAVLLHHNTMLVANAGPCLMPSTFPASQLCMLHMLGLSAFMLIRSDRKLTSKASLFA